MCHSLPTSVADESTPVLSLNPFAPDQGHSYFDASPAQIAARISSLNVAASVVLSGSGLADSRLAESVAFDLLDQAAWLSRQLANFFDDHEFSISRKGA